MKRTSLRSIQESHIGKEIRICGWVRTLRAQKKFAFVEISDGSQHHPFQVVVDATLPRYDELIGQMNTGSAVAVIGKVVESPAKGQRFEMKAEKVELLGGCPSDYPLQKKHHTAEFLRSIAHLRPRTNTQGAVARLRSRAAFAVHRFFQDRGFVFIPAPILTGSDCEGGGHQFAVTTLDLASPPLHKDGTVDYAKDFFHAKAYLTVSGQLNAEAYACALSDVYTFGPTFRAEPSHTARHLAEFWMVEPEMAFADLSSDMECAEAFLKSVTGDILRDCPEELAFFEEFYEPGLVARLQQLKERPFARITYTEAIKLLENSGKSFTYPVSWGGDLQTEHERYLAEEHVKGPLFVTDYPKGIKAFYMRMNEDGKTVAAMDLLAPKIGEIIGGSQREERYDHLVARLREMKLPEQDYWWYLQLRQFGTVPHAGFGLGFERLLLCLTGLDNIRDVIPFPRFMGNIDF